MCLAILSMVMGSAHLLMALPLGLTGVDGFYTAVFIAAGNHHNDDNHNTRARHYYEISERFYVSGGNLVAMHAM